MRAIFISYRREDAEGQAGRLFKDLVEHFGEQAVFMDVAAIEPGRDFRKAIDEHVGSCGVLLSLIGKNWLDAKNDGGVRRLDDSGDFVRLETASALKRDIPVVPVLVHGAQMPRADQLPEDLKDLAYRNAIELTHARWDSDLTVLIKALSRYVTPATAVASPINRANTSSAPTSASEPSTGKSKLMMVGIAAAVVLVAAGLFLFKSGDGKEVNVQGVLDTPPQDPATTKPEQGEAPATPPSKGEENKVPESSPSEAEEGGEQKTWFGVADFNRDGHQDLIVRNDTNHWLVLSRGQGRRGVVKLPRVRIATDWQGLTAFGVVDWDRDGFQDVIARNDATAELWLYPGQNSRLALRPPVNIGVGWNGFTPFGVADWDGDGHQDIVVRNDTNAKLLLYPGESVRRMSNVQPTEIGVGWNGFTPFGMADWDHDGHQDIVTRNDGTGELMLYPGESSRGMSNTQPSKIGVGWNGFTFFGMTDWDGDGNQDILARNDRSRDLMLYPGESSRGMSTAEPVKIGSGF